MEVQLVKKDEVAYKQIVYAEVYAPNRPDSDGEFMTAAEIEKMAHAFAKKMTLDSIDVQHDNQKVAGICIVESFIAREGDPDFISGSWVIGVHIGDEDTWKKVLAGKINGFSMEALVVREKKEVEIEIPPVVSGWTSKDAEHVHKFYVTYDKEGKFAGGVTDSVDGHKHVIRAGTITEKSEGHQHKFSSVDDIQIVE
jgi:hypothetical protein